LRTSDGQQSRHRKLKNGVLQGSILAPCLFNVYISDIPPTHAKQFAYADYLAIVHSTSSWYEVEKSLNKDLCTLNNYYHLNRLRLSREKTIYLVFHLNTRDATQILKLTIGKPPLSFNANLTYLGVKLDQTLKYKAHLMSL